MTRTKVLSKKVAGMLGMSSANGETLVASENDIRYAYRLLLGREPDAGGWKHFREAAKAGQITPTKLVDMLTQSDEYRARNATNAEWVEVNTPGGVVFVRGGDRLIGAALRTGKPYEPYVMSAFEREVQPGDCVLDIGANVGIFTMLAAKLVGEKGRVIAIEPLPQNVHCLCAGVKRNGYSQVEIFPLAASDRTGVVPMMCAADSSNGIVDVHLQSPATESLVPTQRLDTLLAALSRLDIVKIDVEGHEPAAWKGIQSLLAKHKPRVFMEFSPIAIRNHSRTDAADFLVEIFHFAEKISVLHRVGKAVDCVDANAVMAEWKEANRLAGMQGELHLDLLIWPKN